MIQHCFYINLEHRTDRREFIENELAKSCLLKHIAKRFPAIDGTTVDPRTVEPGLLSQNAINDILKDEAVRYGLTLTQGGLGLLLTYVELFKIIKDMNSPVLLIEDDTTIDDTIDYYLPEVLKQLPEDFDLCYLGYADIPTEKVEYSQDLSIPTGMLVCTPSILVSPKGAENILKILKDVSVQIDTALYRNFNSLKAFVTNKKVALIRNSFSTDIQGNINCQKNYTL